MSDENKPPLRRSTRLRVASSNDFSQSVGSRPLKALIDDENEYSEEEKRSGSHQSKRKKQESSDEDHEEVYIEPKKKPRSSKKAKIQSESSDEEDEEEVYIEPQKKPHSSKKAKIQSESSESGSEIEAEPEPKKFRQSKKQPAKTSKPAKPIKETKRKKEPEPKTLKEDVDAFEDVEMDELEAMGLPELEAPREFMDLLQGGPSTSKHISPTKKHEMTAGDTSGEEDWHEIDEPTTKSKKPVVEVVIEKKKKKSKKDKEREELQKQLFLAAEREAKQLIVDLHKLYFLTHLAHLRYQMLCAKEYFEKHKDELDDLIECNLNSTADELQIEDKLKQFRDKFTKDTSNKLCAETSSKMSIKRLHSIMKDSIYETVKDLAMALLILFMSQDISCRLCIGFVGFPELPSTMKVSSKKRTVKFENEKDLQDSDFEETPKPSKSKKKEPVVLKKASKINYWVEYFDDAENDWVPAHPKNEDICSVEDVEKYAKFNYALGVDKDINVLDMTGWYAQDFLLLKFRKSRVEDVWIQSFLNLPEFCSNRKFVAAENQKLQNYLMSKPLPKVVAEYKNHPLYAIEKDLLKFEAFYPPDTKPLGKVRQYDVYPRSAVFTLQGELNWIRQGRNVKEEEKSKPYKVVKARPKLSVPAEERVQLYLNTYGYWQTEPYVPGKVVDGKIPRNEFNNVYMYRPEMIPEGCVHLKEKGVLAMARTLNLEAVGAVTGWEFSGGRNHPTIEGCVVLKKDAEILRAACLEWAEIKKQKKIKAEQSRGLLLWKRLVKGAVLLKNLKDRFNVN